MAESVKELQSQQEQREEWSGYGCEYQAVNCLLVHFEMQSI